MSPWPFQVFPTVTIIPPPPAKSSGWCSRDLGSRWWRGYSVQVSHTLLLGKDGPIPSPLGIVSASYIAVSFLVQKIPCGWGVVIYPWGHPYLVFPRCDLEEDIYRRSLEGICCAPHGSGNGPFGAQWCSARWEKYGWGSLGDVYPIQSAPYKDVALHCGQEAVSDLHLTVGFALCCENWEEGFSIMKLRCDISQYYCDSWLVLCCRGGEVERGGRVYKITIPNCFCMSFYEYRDKGIANNLGAFGATAWITSMILLQAAAMASVSSHTEDTMSFFLLGLLSLFLPDLLSPLYGSSNVSIWWSSILEAKVLRSYVVVTLKSRMISMVTNSGRST